MMKQAALAMLVTATTLVAALPVEAQWWYGGNYNRNINAAQSRVQSRIEWGRRSGLLTAREYNNLMNAFNRIAAREADLRGNRLSWNERQRLINQLNSLENRVNRQIYDRQYAGRRYLDRWF